MLRDLLIEKYGLYITNQFLNEKNEVIYERFNKDGIEEQKEVIKILKNLKNIDGNYLVPDKFWKNEVEWGFDFSSWLGDCNNKDYFFIGAEPHIPNNFQLVYDFGTLDAKTVAESAMVHFSREADIWNYLTKLFVENKSEVEITKFLSKCYITDLCHIVPKHCGQIKDICKSLSIKPGDWKKFRTAVAKKYLLREIKAVNPKYVILHGNPARDFFQNEFGVQYNRNYAIENSKYSIKTGELNGFKVISIPHLKGDVRNKLWKCKKYPERPASAKQILNKLFAGEALVSN